MDSKAKHSILCDSCRATISLPDKGKSKEGDEKKKYEPIPLSAILEHGMEGETKEFQFCGERCLRDFLNDRYSKKRKSKAATFCDVKLFRNW